MKSVTLKNGELLTIREATANDAEPIIQFVKAIGDESDNLTFSGAEFTLTVEEEENILRNYAQKENHIYLIALIDDKIVGQSHAYGSHKARLKHAVQIGISTRKAHWGKGIATEVLNFLIDWAKANSVVRKINLKANASNTKAIALYERMGFVHEGLHKRDFYLHGKFTDAVSMGMLID